MRTQVMEDLKKLFSENPIWTLRKLAKELDYSEISVRMQTPVRNRGGGRSKTAAPGCLYIPHGVGCQFN